MNNQHQHLYELCKEEKEKAMELSNSATTSPNGRHNAYQAITAWDELAGQLRKHKAVTTKRFEKTKHTALRIVALMSDGQYKSSITQKIKSLTLKS